MKKTYTAPNAIVSGDAVRDTRSGIDSGSEGVKRPLAVGVVGFYL